MRRTVKVSVPCSHFIICPKTLNTIHVRIKNKRHSQRFASREAAGACERALQMLLTVKQTKRAENGLIKHTACGRIDEEGSTREPAAPPFALSDVVSNAWDTMRNPDKVYIISLREPLIMAPWGSGCVALESARCMSCCIEPPAAILHLRLPVLRQRNVLLYGCISKFHSNNRRQ